MIPKPKRQRKSTPARSLRLAIESITSHTENDISSGQNFEVAI